MRYALDELFHYERDHSDTLAPTSREAHTSLAGEAALVWPATAGELLELAAAHQAMAVSMAQLAADVRSLQSQLTVSTGAGNTSSGAFSLYHTVRVMANAVPHTLFQWSLSCLQFILLFLSFMSTLLSYYTLVFHFTLLSSPCVGTIQFLHKHAYIHCPYSVSGLSWYQRQSLAPFWLSSRLLMLWSTVLSSIPSTVPVTV